MEDATLFLLYKLTKGVEQISRSQSVSRSPSRIKEKGHHTIFKTQLRTTRDGKSQKGLKLNTQVRCYNSSSITQKLSEPWTLLNFFSECPKRLSEFLHFRNRSVSRTFVNVQCYLILVLINVYDHHLKSSTGGLNFFFSVLRVMQQFIVDVFMPHQTTNTFIDHQWYRHGKDIYFGESYTQTNMVMQINLLA